MSRRRAPAIPGGDGLKADALNGGGELSPCAGRVGRYRLKTPDAYSEEHLRLVAHLYYRQRLDQRQIAALLGLSQAKVSRMLTVAWDRGLVRFFVAECEPRDRDLERRLRRKYKLDSVAVIKTPEGLTPELKRQFVAYFCSPYITSLITPHARVVVAGGRTIGEFIQRLPEDRERSVTVLQALGVFKSALAHVDALELGRALARRWGGYFLALDTPALVSDRGTRDYLLQKSTAGSVCQQFVHADAAIVAVGTPTDSVFANHCLANPHDRALLRQCGAVGEMCGRFFDRRGRECDSPWRDRVISVELERLRALQQVVALVVGRDRSSAVVAAIRGGLLKSLAIDVEAAQGLLRH